MKNPYAVLGAGPSYDETELRLAYIKTVKTAHPDHGGSARHFAEVREAWSILGDPEQRAASAVSVRQSAVRRVEVATRDTVLVIGGVGTCMTSTVAAKGLGQSLRWC